MNRITLPAALLLATALIGCARYPMGLSKTEWEALSPGQQARYRQLQENENRHVQREFEQRARPTDQKAKALENRVRAGPDGHNP